MVRWRAFIATDQQWLVCSIIVHLPSGTFFVFCGNLPCTHYHVENSVLTTHFAFSTTHFHRLQWTQLRALADPVQRVLAQASETHFPSAADLRYAHPSDARAIIKCSSNMLNRHSFSPETSSGRVSETFLLCPTTPILLVIILSHLLPSVRGRSQRRQCREHGASAVVAADAIRD